MKKKVLFVGSGNMAKAIAFGIKDLCEIYTYSPSGISAKELAKLTSGTSVNNLNENNIKFDYVFMAFKPQQFNDFVKSNKPFINPDFIYVSLLAGISTDKIEKEMSVNKIVRFMPNTPISLGKGAGLLLFDSKISLGDKHDLKNILDSVSFNVEVKNDDELNKLTTLSGCGPAYLYEFVKYYSEHFKDISISHNDLITLISKTFEGAALMLLKNKMPIDDLIAQVTSKGGVTIEAINTLRDEDVKMSISKSLDKAYKRARELSS